MTDSSGPLIPPDTKGKIGRGVAAIQLLVERSPALKEAILQLPAGQVILREGQANHHLYILLEGEVLLYKTSEAGRALEVDRFGPGAFLGLTSFWSQQPSFAESRTATPVRCLSLSREAFDRHVSDDPDFSRTLQHLFIDNLSDRYRRMVSLNMRIALLGQELETERNHLRQAIDDLRNTRNRLIHQEKLATLGQLLAGIAHELNNPGAALIRSVDELCLQIPRTLPASTQSPESSLELALFQSGLQCPFWGTEEKARRITVIEQRWPGLPRPLTRRLAQLPDEGRTHLEKATRGLIGSPLVATLEKQLPFFECGLLLRTIKLTSERISRLVTSLKSYGRQDQDTWEIVDLRIGIQDTLTVLNHRLKYFNLTLDLPHPLPARCNAGEINQVWTNLLVNAADVLGDNGSIRVYSESTEDAVGVTIADNGPGVPPELKERIFETNYTTKNKSREFGLGLGLAIAREIAEKHGGSLTVNDAPGGGAAFTLSLPVSSLNG